MAIKLFQLGRHLTSVVVTPQTVGTAGALTAVSTAAATLTAKMNGISQNLQGVLENISSLNSTYANNVLTEDDAAFSVSILKVNDATDPSPLRTLITSYDIYKVAWTEGTGASARTITATVTRENYDDGFQGKGSQIATMSFKQVDNGTETWVIS